MANNGKITTVEGIAPCVRKTLLLRKEILMKRRTSKNIRREIAGIDLLLKIPVYIPDEQYKATVQKATHAKVLINGKALLNIFVDNKALPIYKRILKNQMIITPQCKIGAELLGKEVGAFGKYTDGSESYHYRIEEIFSYQESRKVFFGETKPFNRSKNLTKEEIAA